MNRLRNKRVIVDLPPKEEKKEAFKKEGSLFVAAETVDPHEEAYLISGTVVLVGHEINPQDIKVGDTVYVRRSNGNRLTPDNHHYIFDESAIYGND